MLFQSNVFVPNVSKKLGTEKIRGARIVAPNAVRGWRWMILATRGQGKTASTTPSILENVSRKTGCAAIVRNTQSSTPSGSAWFGGL
tara:strand:+ start:245 stop:505 length:261 start_codon:yes stop_codon:yes gene_type:complete